MVSQSGAYLVTFASNYDGIIQPAASISFGNQMDLTVADFLEHFNGDRRHRRDRLLRGGFPRRATGPSSWSRPGGPAGWASG